MAKRVQRFFPAAEEAGFRVTEVGTVGRVKCMKHREANLLGTEPGDQREGGCKTAGPIPLLAFLLLALPLLNSQSAWSQLVEWPVAEGGNGHFYEVIPAPGGITWDNASLAATERGGYLATITSAAENEFVFNLADQDPTMWYGGFGPWLGGVQPAGSAEPAGGWSWVTGEPFIYQNWAPAQPNNNQNEDRIQFGGQANRSSAWNDVGRNNINFTRGFAVEYDEHPNAIRLEIMRKDSDEVQLSWASRLNVDYTIEWTEDLGGEWNTLTTVVGNGGILTVDDFVLGGGKFYRSSVQQ